MKILKIAIPFILLLVSCTKEDHTETSLDYIGKWSLVQMSGSMQNSQTSGAAMAWQESYIFNPDGTFTKTRLQNSVSSTATGTYITHKISDILYFELTYTKENMIIGTCSSTLSEELYFSASNTLSSTWKNCDGPGLDYQKVNK